MALTIFGGHGFIGSQYVRDHYDPAISNIASVNDYLDYEAHSSDVLYMMQPYRYFVDLIGASNLEIFVHVLDSWRRRSDAHCFNLLSSAKVEHALNSSNTQANTLRVAAEQLLKNYCEAYGLHYRILRAANIVGRDCVGDPKKNVLPYLISRLAEGDVIEVQGDFRRDYMHVEDCSRALDYIVENGALDTIYNVGNGRTESFVEILEYVQKALGRGRIKHDGVLTAPLLSFAMDTRPLQNLGYVPKYLGEKLFQSLVPVK